MSNDLAIYDKKIRSRLLLGTALYPSPEIMAQAIKESGTEIITVSIRRELGGDENKRTGQQFWDFLSKLNLKILPNTAGCKTVKEAVTTAYMAREIFATDWIKLEVITDDDSLHPEIYGLVEATKILIADGFKVLPYCTEDLSTASKLIDFGCKVIMPWGAPIGSGQGLNNIYGLRSLRARFSEITMIVDAGIGAPSHATQALELGFDAVLLNTAVAKANNPILMAKAFKKAIEAGHFANQAGLMPKRDMAVPSTPTIGQPFWHHS